MAEVKYIAPDGGWGWLIVFSYGLSNIFIISIFQTFGMVYADKLKEYGISATQSSIIINTNQAFGLIVGIVNGPLIRKYGFRKIAIAGSLTSFTGIILTSFSTRFIHFIIAYGMVTSFGAAMQMTSFTIAINTYFKEKRGPAMGVTMTITGLGLIFMPQLISILLPIYGTKGTMLISGALSFHGLVCSSLLQPIKWHAKREKIIGQEMSQIRKESLKNEPAYNYVSQDSEAPLNDMAKKFLPRVDNESKKSNGIRNRKTSVSSADCNTDNISTHGFEMTMQNASLLDVSEDMEKLKNKEDKKLLGTLSFGNNSSDPKSSTMKEVKVRKISPGLLKYGDLAYSKVLLVDYPEKDMKFSNNNNANNLINDTPKATKQSVETITLLTSLPIPEESTQRKRRSLPCRILHQIVTFFDLTLLRDPVYINIMLGMSFALFAELNFAVLMPFILSDMNLGTNEIAVLLSVIASSDLAMRMLAPFIGQRLRKPPRVMFFLSLVFLILTRTGMIFAKTYYKLLAVELGFGTAKGIRTVYMTLIIPNQVPLERLPAASSIQSLTNGLILLTVGPVLGILRDLTGNYTAVIMFLNFVTAITLIMWTTEYAIKIVKRRKKMHTVLNTKRISENESQ